MTLRAEQEVSGRGRKIEEDSAHRVNTHTEQYADTQANQLHNPRFQLIKKSIPEHGYVYMSLKKGGGGGAPDLRLFLPARKLSGAFWGRCAEEPLFIYIKTSIITNHEESEFKKNMAVSCK